MGSVDLADMRRLHCISALMGQNRWWLKLFFYNLDVGTANALVLYRAAMDSNAMNIVDYKEKIVLGLVGSRIEDVCQEPLTLTHELTKIEKRYRCAYCALFSVMPIRRTSFICKADCCNLPLCSIGASKAGDTDCFALAHANEQILKATKMKFAAMQATTNTGARKKK